MGDLRISFDTDLTPDARARLVLVVGTEEFAFKDADFRGANTRTWHEAGLTWSAGTAVNIKIVEGAAVALPSAPRNLEARAGNKKVTLSWDPPDIFGTGGLTKYERRRKIANVSYDIWRDVPGGASATSFVQSNLSNGTTYIYQIRAHSSAGAGPASEEASATPRESTTPTIDSVKITSAPRADDTYRAGDEIEFTMTFDQEVRVTQKNATPTILLGVGDTKYASYAGGSPGFELRFVYVVRPTDFDDNGVSIHGSFSNSSFNTIFDWYGGSIKGEDGKTADRRYAGRGSDSGHKVKASSVLLESAVTSGDGERIVLTFRKSTHGELFLPVDTELAERSADAPVTVRVAGALREVTAGEVVGGTALTLTLASPVRAGESVTVSYERPASGPRIEGVVGNAVRRFSRTVENRTVENFVADAPRAPALTASPRVDSALLLWTPPEHTGASPITGYEYRRAVHGTQESSAYGRWTAIADSAALTSYRVGGLEGGTTYSFQLRAVNASGKGLPSEHAYATPLVDSRSQPPKGVRVAQGPDSNSLTVTWNAVPAPGLVTADGKAEFTGYTVWYRLRGTDEEEAQSVREGVQRGWSLRQAGASRTGSTRYTLTGLRPDTAYAVRVSTNYGVPGHAVWYRSSANVTARTGAGERDGSGDGGDAADGELRWHAADP